MMNATTNLEHWSSGEQMQMKTDLKKIKLFSRSIWLYLVRVFKLKLVFRIYFFSHYLFYCNEYQMVQRPEPIDAALPELSAPVRFIQSHLRSKHLRQSQWLNEWLRTGVFTQDCSKLNLYGSSGVFMHKERAIDQISLWRYIAIGLSW